MSNVTLSDQNVPMPTRNRLADLIDRIGEKVEIKTEERLQTDAYGVFMNIATTLTQIGRAWVGDHDEDVKELMTLIADADIQVALQKEIELAEKRGQDILP